jgi:hypothetical protein
MCRTKTIVRFEYALEGVEVGSGSRLLVSPCAFDGLYPELSDTSAAR